MELSILYIFDGKAHAGKLCGNICSRLDCRLCTSVVMIHRLLGRASSQPHSYVLTWLSVTIYIGTCIYFFCVVTFVFPISVLSFKEILYISR